jgi:hypothetical protein
MQSVTVRFVVWADFAGVEWMPIEFAAVYVEEFIQHWLDDSPLTCCDFQGGFEIDVDGKWWNDGAIDEFWMTMHWFQAIEAFLNGATEQEIRVWEEGHLILQRTADAFTMYERNHRPDACPPVTVSFNSLVTQMCAQAQVFAAWVRSLHEEVNRRLPNADFKAIGRSFVNRDPETTEEKLAKIFFEVPLSFVDQIERVCELAKNKG